MEHTPQGRIGGLNPTPTRGAELGFGLTPTLTEVSALLAAAFCKCKAAYCMNITKQEILLDYGNKNFLAG